MIESELIYEKEITPNISLHVVRIMREEIEDVELVRRMLNILSSYDFDVGGNDFFKYCFNIKTYFF